MRDPALERFDALFGPEFGHGKPFDLAPLRATLSALGNPQDKLPPVIHVAGTNGKGSTIAFMRSIAWSGGLRVHAFTKPHLNALRERFQLTCTDDGASWHEYANDEALIAYAERVAATGRDLTQFDAQVCVAVLLFSETPGDLVLIETGMGGRDDSTNVIGTPALAVITPIAVDHADALGPTLADIARHKAGIIKPGCKVISARQEPEVLEILQAAADDADATLYEAGRDWDAYESNGLLVVQTESGLEDYPPPNLPGRHQYDNAGLAAAALTLLNLPGLHRGHFSGTMLAMHPGRLQRLTRGALVQPIISADGEVWIDGGHNAHAATALAHWLRKMDDKRPAHTVAIVGMLARKDADAFVGALASAVDEIIAVPLAETHIAPETLADIAIARGVSATTAPSLAAAMQNAAQFPAPRVLITGSFVLAAEALAAESG